MSDPQIGLAVSAQFSGQNTCSTLPRMPTRSDALVSHASVVAPRTVRVPCAVATKRTHSGQSQLPSLLPQKPFLPQHGFAPARAALAVEERANRSVLSGCKRHSEELQRGSARPWPPRHAAPSARTLCSGTRRGESCSSARSSCETAALALRGRGGGAP